MLLQIQMIEQPHIFQKAIEHFWVSILPTKEHYNYVCNSNFGGGGEG